MSEEPDGPWQCRHCAHQNPAIASYCIKCSAPRGPRIRLIWIAAAAAIVVVLSMSVFLAYTLG